MKKLSFILTLLVLTLNQISGQMPQKFNYQALIKDNTDKPLIEKSVSLRFSILHKTATGTVKYSEIHSTTTDKNGMVNIMIGTGIPTGSFSSINWSDGPYFLKIELKYTTVDYVVMGTAELASVPYSMVASNLGGSLDKLKVKGQTTSPDSTLFEVKNKDGKTVFAVYNEGVRVYVPNSTAKGSKGGFAIGGFGSEKTGTGYEFFRVTSDSIRIYIDTLSNKATKGGFAIGTVGAAKGKNLEFLRVTPDSVRIYVEKEKSKGTKGGFAIGGFSTDKGETIDFLHLTPKNYFIGHNSGKNITTGLYNSFLGYMSGYKNTAGSSNTFFGDSTGLNNTTGSWNVFIGKDAGRSNETSVSNVFIGNEAGKMAKHISTSTASYNVAIGTLAGYYNNGKFNVFLGQESGFSNTKGKQNVFIGMAAGYYNDTASYNVAIGTNAGYNNMGLANVFMGNFAGAENLGANYNVFIGNNAGTSTTSGEKNVILGSDAGYENTTGTYNTFIGNLAGSLNTIGEYNLYAGSQAGYSNITGSYNVFLGNNAGFYAKGSNNTAIGNAAGEAINSDYNTMMGFQTGYSTTTGSRNAFFGHQAGHENTTGSYNTIIGPLAGYSNTSGSNNVFIGKWAGYYETGSDKLYIDNSDNYSSGALIYGDFYYHQLRLNAYVGINSSPDSYYRLYITGAAYASGNFWTGSDIRLKQNIRSMEGDGVIDKVKNLEVIKFNYKNEVDNGDTIGISKYIGVIAQEIEKDFPEAVRTDDKGFKAVNYNAITAILLQAIKDQQRQIDTLKNEIVILKTKK